MLESVQSGVTDVASKVGSCLWSLQIERSFSFSILILLSLLHQVSDIGKRGWNNLAGGTNMPSQGGYNDPSQEENSYQRSHSVGGNLASGLGQQSGVSDSDWGGWQENANNKTHLTSSSSYHNQLSGNNAPVGSSGSGLTHDDDWSGFTTTSYQNSETSYQNTPSGGETTRRSMKMQETSHKLSEGFDNLDVKNVKPKAASAGGKASAEDDAWNLLMN